jgi:hypothetical protein
MQAGAAVIPDSGNNEHVVVLAQLKRPLEHQGLGQSRRAGFLLPVTV